MADPSGPYLTGPHRIRVLDGVRGIAILLVIASHAEMSAHAGSSEWLARLGDLGVKLFFVLSGFLITRLLLREQERTGRIDYWHFMVRRAFRILPPAYVFILSVMTASALGVVVLNPGDAVHALTYTTDFSTPSWWLGHLWSLSIEEQFYVLWPLLLGLVRPRISLYLMVGSLAAAAMIRGTLLIVFPELTDGIERSFVIAMDGFGAGGLLAALMPRLTQSRLYMRMLETWWAPLLILPAAGLDLLEHHPLVFYVVLQTAIYLLLAVWLHRCLAVSDDWLARVLGSRMLGWLGLISYSLYLWQQPFLAPRQVQLVHSFPLALALALACATASYFLVEQPFLRLRDRVVSSRTSAIGPVPPPSTGPVEGVS